MLRANFRLGDYVACFVGQLFTAKEVTIALVLVGPDLLVLSEPSRAFCALGYQELEREADRKEEHSSHKGVFRQGRIEFSPFGVAPANE